MVKKQVPTQPAWRDSGTGKFLPADKAKSMPPSRVEHEKIKHPPKKG